MIKQAKEGKPPETGSDIKERIKNTIGLIQKIHEERRKRENFGLQSQT